MIITLINITKTILKTIKKTHKYGSNKIQLSPFHAQNKVKHPIKVLKNYPLKRYEQLKFNFFY